MSLDPCDGSSLFVLVCGLPGSGNKLLARLFREAGAECSWSHGDLGAAEVRQTLADHDHRIIAVMPVRDAWSMNRSNAATWPLHRREMATETMLGVMLAESIPLRLVSYESLYLYPETSRRDLLEWAGLPDVPWPDAPRDENAKHHAEDVIQMDAYLLILTEERLTPNEGGI